MVSQNSGNNNPFTPQVARSQRIASAGIRSTRDFANLMSALMSDVLDGTVDTATAKAVTGAGAMLLKTVELQHRYGKAETPLVLAESQESHSGHAAIATQVDIVLPPAAKAKANSAPDLIIQAMSLAEGRRDTVRLITAWMHVNGAPKITENAVESILDELVDTGLIKPKPSSKGDDTDRWTLA